MAGPLRSADIAPLHRYYGPSRHPLVFGRLPGFAGYTAYLAPTISRRDEEGFSSCSACPCHRAVAFTPPRWRCRIGQISAPHAAFALRLRARPSEPLNFEATSTFTVVTARQLVVSPRETLSIGFRILISLHPAIRTTGLLTVAPAGLHPAEHTSLNWTHFRTASFPQYGWKADCPSGAFLGDRRLKPAPGIRRPPSSLHPPFVHFVVATVVRSESGLRTRSCTAMRWNIPPTPGALARVRVVVSRSVIT